MIRTGFRVLLFASLPGFTAAQAASLHASPTPPAATSKTHKKTSNPLQGNAEAITVRTIRNTPHLARKVTLGALGNRSEFDTPFSVSSISAARMEAMQANDINDVMRYEPGVQATSNGGSTASGSSVRVRGLNLDWTNGYKIDGLAIPFWYIDLPVANFDTIQVYKGASAFMYGFGSPGGVLDYRLKAPVEQRKITLEAGYRSDAVFRQMLDVGGSLDSAHRVQTRLSFGSEVGEQYNSSFERNLSMSFTTDVRITDALHWHFNSFYMNTLQKGMVNTILTTPGLGAVTPVSGRTAFGAENSWKTNDLRRFSTGFDWNFAKNWTANLTYAYTHLNEQFPSNQLTFIGTNGDYKSQAYEQMRVLTYHQVDFTTQGHFNTGALRHDVLIGMTYLRQMFDWDANVGAKLPFEYGNINTNRPVISNGPDFSPQMYRYINYQQLAPYWNDTVTLGKWSLMAGARYTAYTEDDFTKTGASNGSHRNNPVTPIVSLTYKAAPWINTYFSWVQAVQTGGQAPQGTKNYSQVFSPIRSDQYELGVKVQRRTFSGTLALFRMDTGAAYTNAQNYYIQNGISRYQGVEASASWLITKSLNLNASLAYLDAHYIRAAASYVGHQLEAVAPLQAALNADYRIPAVRGLSVNGGFNYVSRSWLDAANTVHLPSYIVGEIGAAYITHVDTHAVTIRANVENIGNVRYWMSRGNYNIFPGAPRTITLSARLDL
ncbi:MULTISPECIES: TonB-dependent siderophore receptor [Acetobacter]|uniref:TonB-dependent siderophore receptor n=1 Tax=Acetobacter TaxID=434 RepID=UPI0037706967